MPHQLALTIRARVRAGQVEQLKRVLAAMREGGPGSGIPFERLPTTHFARLFVLDEAVDLDGEAIPASLVYMSDVDAPAWRHLVDLVRVGGAALDEVFGHCEGWPGGSRTPWPRVAWLRARMLRANTVYVNTVGRGVRQVHDERLLHDAIEEFLDGKQADWRGVDPVQVHEAVLRHVAGRQDLRWALDPAPGPGLWFRLRGMLHLLAGPALLLVGWPLLVVVLPVWAVLLRRHEREEVPATDQPERRRLHELAALEDHVVQNPFTAVGLVKRGRFRLLTMLAILRVVDYGTRHIFNHGSLTRVKSIHFARWVAIDEGRRLIFASSYDGSLESYMDEFIDKVAWGLNAVFSNGDGYPRTSWLVKGGANDEQAFKNYLRVRQVPTHVWYSAYADLSTGNIENNAAIRAGLGGGPLSGPEARAWLARL